VNVIVPVWLILEIITVTIRLGLKGKDISASNCWTFVVVKSEV
jgi:hypothetical protein